MVSFRLTEHTDDKLTYYYYPNAKEDKGHGVIVVDRKAGKIDVTRLAPEDNLLSHSVEDQLIVRQTANDLRKESGLPEYTEEEWPIPTAVRYTTEFADQALKRIVAEYNAGHIIEQGEADLSF